MKALITGAHGTVGAALTRRLERQAREQGRVAASERWLPATSFLDDTADALIWLASAAPDLYLLDANERWSFYDIARALSLRHGARWEVIPTQDFVFDQRMRDARVRMPSLQERLPDLR